MIETHEGLGGWTIVVKNEGYPDKRFECAQYIIKDEHGTPWFDWDKAMYDAKELDNKQRMRGKP